MTTLEAVNELLQATGQPAVSATTATGTFPTKTYDNATDQGEAELYLDRECKKILNKGWYQNTVTEFRINAPLTKLTIGAITGTYTFGETVTEATSLATGTFNYQSGGFMYVYTTSGTFVGTTKVLTGGTSGATCTDSAVATLTSGRIAYPSTWLKVVPANSEWRSFTPDNGYFYLLGSPPVAGTDPTFNFSGSIAVNYVEWRDISAITQALAEYVVRSACVKFQRYKRNGAEVDGHLLQELALAKVRADQEEQQLSGRNLCQTAAGRLFTGQYVPVAKWGAR